MPVTFNHAIIAARNRKESASFLSSLFGLSEPSEWGPFSVVTLDGSVFLQFAEPDVDEIQMQHFAFLVDDETFDAAYARLRNSGISYWADPQMSREGEFNHNHGGRGVYFKDPSGHGMEIITRPYAAGQ